MKKILLSFIAISLMVTSSLAQNFPEDENAIIAVIDDFHDAAAKADEDRYLEHFTEDGVFLGTDEWERWPLKPEFTDYVAKRFKNGGWSYRSEKKSISFSKKILVFYCCFFGILYPPVSSTLFLFIFFLINEAFLSIANLIS